MEYIRLMQPFDLSLLVTLDALLKTESVQEAAGKMNVSPPAMSHSLARLRDYFNDPLLVRAGQRMVLTPKALDLRQPVGELVSQGRALFGLRESANPQTVARRFTIRASSTSTALFASAILTRVKQRMPLAELRFVPEAEENAAPLRDGSIDLDLGVDPEIGPEIRKEVLLEEPFAIVRRKGHPYRRPRLSEAQYVVAKHVVASRRGVTRGPIDRTLAQNGKTREVAIIVPEMLTAVTVAATSDLLATVPLSVALWAGRTLQLTMSPLPFGNPSVTLFQSWHPRMELDSFHQLLRTCVSEAVQNAE